jgi:secreted trypsin-like serine protease
MNHLHLRTLSSTCVLVFSAAVVFGQPAGAQQGQAPELSKMQVRGSDDFQRTVEAFLNGDEPKIVGGRVAPDNAYPWQVSLVASLIADPYRGHFCGGSVYNAKWIVTAAHCVRGNQPQDVHVISGVNKLTKNAARTNVNRIFVQNMYNPKTFDTDIALLELHDTLVFDERTKSIDLLAAKDEAQVLAPGRTLTVTGWGATQERGRPIKDLRFVDIPSVSRATCNQPPSYNGNVTENMICAGRAIGGQDACQGDSGGPLVADKSTAPKLAGIVSWGGGCAQFAKYGVYTRVARYNAWIQQCTNNPSAC